MRLTTVTQMSLPPGRLRSLAAPAVGERGRELPVSFDQQRHVGAGDRPGSWMAFALRLPISPDSPWSDDDIATAWAAVIARHGTMRTAFSRDADGEIHLHDIAVSAPQWREHEVAEGVATRDALRELLDAQCRPFAQPSYLLCVLEPAPGEPDARPVAVIASDHSHVDMWSLAIVARDLLAALTGTLEDDSVPSFPEHSAGLEAAPPAPADVHQRWADILAPEGGAMPVFPLPLGDVSTPQPAIVDVRDVLDAEQTIVFEGEARARGVRMISLALAQMAGVTRRMSGQAMRAVFPVHSRHEPRWQQAVGWFITNSVIECDSDDPTEVSLAVKEALRLGGYPLAEILVPYGGMRTPPGMFAISWLDTRRLPVAIDPALNAQHVSAVIETDNVMIWFIVNDAGLHLRCRYPDTPDARESMSRWLDEVSAALRNAALAPVT